MHFYTKALAYEEFFKLVPLQEEKSTVICWTQIAQYLCQCTVHRTYDSSQCTSTYAPAQFTLFMIVHSAQYFSQCIYNSTDASSQCTVLMLVHRTQYLCYCIVHSTYASAQYVSQCRVQSAPFYWMCRRPRRVEAATGRPNYSVDTRVMVGKVTWTLQ